MFVLILQVFLWTPFGQTILGNIATSYLSKYLKTTISISRIEISFFKFIEIKDLYVEDQKGDTLAYIHNLQVGIRKLKFADDKTVLYFNRVELDRPVFYLEKAKGDSNTNLTFILEAFSSDSPPSDKDVIVRSRKTLVHNGKFTWHDYNFAYNDSAIDWKHLEIDSIELDAEHYHLINDSMTAVLKKVGLVEQSGFDLDTLAGSATFSSTVTQVENLKIVTPGSRISAFLRFDYDSVADYSEFITNVHMKADIDTSNIALDDIAYFASTLNDVGGVYTLAGSESGPVNRMNFRNLFIGYKDHTRIRGNISISGLPDVASTFVSAHFKEVSTSWHDLNGYKFPPSSPENVLSLPEKMKVLGIIRFKGDFTGFFNDFVTYGLFTTDAGSVYSDLKLNPGNESGEIDYSGYISTKELNLGLLLENPEMFGLLTMNMSVKGKNLDFEKMDMTAEGKIERIDLNGYSYRNIDLDGGISYKEIQGIVHIDDPNLKLDFDGMINLQNTPIYAFEMSVPYSRPTRLHWIDRDSNDIMRFDSYFNFQGNSIDNIIGRAGITDFSIEEYEELTRLKKVELIAMTSKNHKTIALESENINAQLNGEFKSSDVINGIKTLVYNWMPNLYDAPPPPLDTINTLNFHLSAWNFSGFSKLLLPSVTFRDTIEIDVIYRSDSAALLVDIESPQINVKGTLLDNFTGDLYMTMDTVSLELDMEKLVLTDKKHIDNFMLNAIMDTNEIDLHTIWSNEPDTPAYSGNIKARLKVESTEQFSVDFDSSEITINDTTWHISDSAYIAINGKTIDLQNFRIENSGQGVFINGRISENPDDTMGIVINNFDLDHLNRLLSYKNISIKGVVRGHAMVQDVYHELIFTSDLKFDSLRINEQSIGTGHVTSAWSNNNDRLDVDLYFKDKNLERINLKGSYAPRNESNQLDFILKADSMPISVAEPFVKDFVTDLSGSLSGNATIKGMLKNPDIDGHFTFNKVRTRVVYLNNYFNIDNQEVFFMNDLIGCDAIRITDDNGKALLMNLSIFHSHFSHFNIDMSIYTLDRMMVLNTTPSDNETFYGTIYLDKGAVIGIDTDQKGNYNLNATAKLGKDTKVYIPLYESSDTDDNNFIHFISYEDQKDSTEINKLFLKKEESNFNLDLAIELSPDAQVQLLFDKYANDNISAAGEGNINIGISAEKGFTINGTYEITKGSYLFTFSNIISKYFNIHNGSRISWNGDPMTGQADITAGYKLRTSLYDLGITAAYDTSELQKRIPVEVLLYMKNNYMNPDLEFGFNLPTRYDEVEALLNGLDNNEKNKQVFSLLILNKFLPLTGSAGGVDAAGAIGASTAEMISNQLSNWLSQISQEVDIGVRYKPGDEISADEVEVALSTQLFNDRLLIETNVGFATGPNASSQANNIVGEFTLTYKINKRGNLTAKVFNRSNELNPVYQNQAPYTQGIGIGYTEYFFSMSDLGCRMANNVRKEDNKRDCVKEYRMHEESITEKRIRRIDKKMEYYRKVEERKKERASRKQSRKADRKKKPGNPSDI